MGPMRGKGSLSGATGTSASHCWSFQRATTCPGNSISCTKTSPWSATISSWALPFAATSAPSGTGLPSSVRSTSRAPLGFFGRELYVHSGPGHRHNLFLRQVNLQLDGDPLIIETDGVLDVWSKHRQHHQATAARARDVLVIGQK